MYDYDSDQGYDEIREDFIDEFKEQLEERGEGEELELIAEGTPFEHFALKGDGTLIHPSIQMEQAYITCNGLSSEDMYKTVSEIFEIDAGAELIPQEQLEQIDNIIIFPINLTRYQDKLEESHIAYMPQQDMAATFLFHMEKGTSSYCREVTNEHLERWGINAEELFETVRYKDLEELGIRIVNQYDALTEEFNSGVSWLLRPATDVPIALKEMYQVYGMNGFGAVWYPRVMEQLHEILGSEMLIVPHDVYCAYIQTPKLGSVSELLEKLQVDNEVKAAYGDGRHIMSERIFKYDLDNRNLVPAVEPKIEKKKMR